jgi:hypothetical protein
MLKPKRIRLVITTKEFGEMVGRTPEWVRDQCRAGKIPTFPHLQRPYLIPRKALMKAMDLEHVRAAELERSAT